MTKKTQNQKAFKGYKINRGKLKMKKTKYKFELKERLCEGKKERYT